MCSEQAYGEIECTVEGLLYCFVTLSKKIKDIVFSATFLHEIMKRRDNPLSDTTINGIVTLYTMSGAVRPTALCSDVFCVLFITTHCTSLIIQQG